MTTATEFVDLYQVLGVAETADADAIKTAIRNQRRIWNKRAGQSDPVMRAQAEQRIRQIAEAERVLLNPNSRRQFDQAAKTRRPEAAPAAAAADGARDWLTDARQYFEQGNAPSAYYAAREAIAVNGANHEAWSIRANSSFLMGNFQDAGFEFREAIRLQPDNPEYHFDYAEAFMATGALNDAMGEYETALRLAPGNPLYRTAIANVNLQKGDSAKALMLMEAVVKEYPSIQAFQYYLALALHDFSLTKVSQLRDGRYICTSPAQIENIRTYANRALSLKYDDADLRRSLQESLNIAEDAACTRWFHSNILGWLIALAIGCALIAVHGIGVAVVVIVIAAYVLLHRMPVWKHNAKLLGIVKRGI